MEIRFRFNAFFICVHECLFPRKLFTALRKLSFKVAKGHLLRSKTLPLSVRKLTFCKSKDALF